MEILRLRFAEENLLHSAVLFDGAQHRVSRPELAKEIEFHPKIEGWRSGGMSEHEMRDRRGVVEFGFGHALRVGVREEGYWLLLAQVGGGPIDLETNPSTKVLVNSRRPRGEFGGRDTVIAIGVERGRDARQRAQVE